MILTDYHVHSTCSFDASNTMSEMVKTLASRGVSAMCFTDHIDFGVAETMQLKDFQLEKSQLEQYPKALEIAPKGMFIGLGVEMGQAHHDIERAKNIYAMKEFDFVLGSIHSLRNTLDFYYLDYTSEKQCFELYDRYALELIELADIDCFDAMAHIGYCVRCMNAMGFPVYMTLKSHGDMLEVLFKKLIQNGKGIELNCADLVEGGRPNPLMSTIPVPEVLKLYRDLGGELITIGSDSHNIKAAGLGISEGYEILRTNGFKYVTMYKKHKAEMIRI